jgi:CheY-like chemotaxis protein
MPASLPPDPIADAEVLVVEDHALSRESLIDILEAEGYRVVSAVNGQEALDLLRRGLRPCVILLDLAMPVMDGAAFCKEQQREPALAAIPVVVMTGVQDSPQQAFEIAAGHYFLKPYSVQDLLDTIARYCRGSREAA